MFKLLTHTTKKLYCQPFYIITKIKSVYNFLSKTIVEPNGLYKCSEIIYKNACVLSARYLIIISLKSNKAIMYNKADKNLISIYE